MRRKRRIIKPPKVVKEKPISQYSRIDSEGREARNKFEALRRSLGLTQEIFGEKLGLSKQLVHFYETDRSSPTIRTWIKMKANAALHEIELSDEIIDEFMQKKFDNRKKRLQDQLDQINDKINQYKET
jgi:DNA-binding XRE family transcriptional regulator